MLRKRFEETVVERNTPPQSSELPVRSSQARHEPGDGLAVAGDHDIFTALDLSEET